MKRIITLTTDFGDSDYDTGVLKGVIWSLAPQTQIADLSHAIRRHDVLEAALLLNRCTPYFPERTIHVVVVDPGVGTQRRGLAARLGRQWFVGPDNGLLTCMHSLAISDQLPIEIYQLSRPQYWLEGVSPIFHGRDIFAAVAGHLAAGVPLSEVGDPVTDPILLDIPIPEPIPGGWRGRVMQVDSFGNLATNLEPVHLQHPSHVRVKIRGQQIYRLVRTFGEGRDGELVALIDSAGKLSLCAVNGSAERVLGARVGDQVEVFVE